ncbi:stimulated by retinoic acid gene 6 protein-like [Crassostrea virginica]
MPGLSTSPSIDATYGVTSGGNSSNSSTQITCAVVQQLLYGYNLLPVAGIIAILVLIFLEKRTYKRECFFGRPGLPVPVNILDGEKNALPTAACFGCCINYLFYILFLNDSSGNADAWLATFYLLKYVIYMGISYYPLFACVNSTSRIGASLVGLLFTVFLLFMSVIEFNVCVDNAVEFCGYLPFFVCEGYLSCLFVFRLVYQVYKSIAKKSKQSHRIVAKISQYTHVKELLKRCHDTSEIEIRSKLTSSTIQLLQETKTCCLNKSIQRCNMRTITVNFVVLLSFYQMFIVFVDVSQIIYNIKRYFENGIHALNVSSSTVDVSLDTVYYSFIIAQVLSVIYVISMMFLIYKSQKQHLIDAWRGDKSFIPKKCLNMESGEIITKSLMFAGTQVSHLLGSYLISILVIFLISMILAFFLILPLLNKVPEIFLRPVKFLVPSMVVTYIFVYLLKKLSERIFLQKQWISSKQGNGVEKTLALDNRKVYHNFSYFLFFFYILIGLFKCIRRVGYSMVIGLFFVPRLDRSVLVSGFEHYDNAYMIYIGLLHMELVHCHPVLRVFCEELLQSNSSRKKDMNLGLHSANSIDTSSIVASYRSTRHISVRAYNKQILNRWMKFITLCNNPKLCETSSTNVKFHLPRDTI